MHEIVCARFLEDADSRELCSEGGPILEADWEGVIIELGARADKVDDMHSHPP